MRRLIFLSCFLLVPLTAHGTELLYTIQGGNYDEFLDGANVFGGFASTFTANVLVYTTPDESTSNWAKYSILNTEFTSGTYTIDLSEGTASVANHLNFGDPLPYDQLDLQCHSPAVPVPNPYGFPYIPNFLEFQLTTSNDVWDTTVLPTVVNPSDFPSAFFTLQVDGTPTNYGSYVEGQITSVSAAQVTTPALPAGACFAPLAVLGLGRRPKFRRGSIS